MIIKYSPYESPFAPCTPGVHYVPKDHQYLIPHDAHVLLFMSLELDSLSKRIEQANKKALLDELESMSFDSGIKAARRRYRDESRDSVPFKSRKSQGERLQCLD